MNKIALGIAIPLVAWTLTACGNNSNQQDDSQNSVSSVQTAKASSELDANQLTPKQTAALVLYYGDAHMPGANHNDYSANMAKSGQGATIKIYEKDNAPKKERPIYDYPDGAGLLYVIKLTNAADNNGKQLNSIYYTIANDKIYISDGDGGFSSEGVTPAEMVSYAKKHDGVQRVNNVAQSTKLLDMRSTSSTTTSSSTKGNDQDLTTQQLGTLVALYKAPDWFKQYIDDGTMYYDENSDYSSEVRGYSCITANGDPTSFIYFKRNGNDVTVKMVEPKGDETVAEASMITHHITVSQLIDDYYTNQSQKDEVNGYANKLKPESEYNESIKNND